MDKYKVFTVVLPDTDRADTIARQLESFAEHRINHQSGRPWILTKQLNITNIVHTAEPFHVATIGSINATEEYLSRLVSKVGSLNQLSQISKEVAGSFLVFGTNEKESYSNAPALQSKRLFHAVIDGVRIIADRADLLADLGSFPINRARLGMRMLRGLPHDVETRPMWDQVQALPGWEYLLTSQNGYDFQTVRWWDRPKPELRRAEAAERLHAAINQSVQARTSSNNPIVCDLSGGLDSTPICYFASVNSDNIYAHTYYTNDPGGKEDLYWAKKAIHGMPNLKAHQIYSNSDMPGFYQHLAATTVPMDFPSSASGTVPRLARMLQKDKELGSLMHLNGLGGDHLLRGVKPWNHTIAEKNFVLGWKRARDEDIPDGINALTTLRELRDRRSFTQWLFNTIDQAFSGHEASNDLPHSNDWSVPISLPNWLSASFTLETKTALEDAAASAIALDTNRGGHFDIQTVLHATALARAMEQAGNYLGVSYEAPLLDDHVIDVIFATRHEERDTPIEWKPLMKEAMRGSLPEDFLKRTSKIGGAPQAVRGFEENYIELTDLWEDSGLFEYEFFDFEAMEKAILPNATSMPLGHIGNQNNLALFLTGVNL